MRFSKSASTLARQKYYDGKPALDLARTNTFSEDDLQIDKRSELGILDVKKSNLVSRTKSANFALNKHSAGKFKNFIAKSVVLVNMNSHFHVENSAGFKTNHQSSDNSTSMERGETCRKSPVDRELKAYVSQKKNIREKIQDHWKLELNAKSLQKGAPINIINREMFRPDQQWIDINIGSSQSNNKASLIEAFTANLDKVSETETYKVNGDVGSVIAQKLTNGEQMRICRNGQPVKKSPHLENVDSPTDLAFNQTKKKEHSNSSFFTEMPIPRNSILSWNDQVQKQNIRIIEPSTAEVKTHQQVSRPERRLVVKKLVDEDQFKPKSKKSITESKEYRETLNQSPRRQTTIKAIEVTRTKTPVEIVGVSRKTTITESETKTPSYKEEKLIDPDEIFTVRLSPAKSFRTNGKLYENLNEKNYDEIVENMTNRFTSEKSQDFNDLLKKKSKKVNFDKRRHVSFNFDSKLNSNSKDNNLKLLEKKYKKLISSNSSYNGNLICRHTPNIEPDSQILKDLNIFKTNSSYETLKMNLKDSQLNESVNFRLNSIADGLHDLNSGKYVPKFNLTQLKPLNTLSAKTNSKIYSS